MKKLTAIILLAMVGALLLTSCGGGFNASREMDVYVREDGSGTRGAFNELFGIVVDGTDRTTLDADILQTTAGIITSVAGNVHGISYASVGALNDSVKALPIDGVSATAANIRNGTYSIFRPFNIAINKAAPLSAVAQDFHDFIMSAEGQAVVTARDFISVDLNAPAFAGSQPGGTVTVEGSSSVTPLMERLITAYAAVNPNATVQLQSNSSGVGITAATEGRADIGMVSRALRESELENLYEIAIALDGIAVIVHPDNTTTGLTSAQVTSIFIGEATVWNEVR